MSDLAPGYPPKFLLPASPVLSIGKPMRASLRCRVCRSRSGKFSVATFFWSRFAFYIAHVSREIYRYAGV